ncbi:MAG: hypothetical protein HQ461_07305 [Deltaproteobacteria bacterium]|nr:hypothetical protein [Deltaproteobacteria bacterium]
MTVEQQLQEVLTPLSAMEREVLLKVLTEEGRWLYIVEDGSLSKEVVANVKHIVEKVVRAAE